MTPPRHRPWLVQWVASKCWLSKSDISGNLGFVNPFFLSTSSPKRQVGRMSQKARSCIEERYLRARANKQTCRRPLVLVPTVLQIDIRTQAPPSAGSGDKGDHTTSRAPLGVTSLLIRTNGPRPEFFHLRLSFLPHGERSGRGDPVSEPCPAPPAEARNLRPACNTAPQGRLACIDGRGRLARRHTWQREDGDEERGSDRDAGEPCYRRAGAGGRRGYGRSPGTVAFHASWG